MQVFRVIALIILSPFLAATAAQSASCLDASRTASAEGLVTVRAGDANAKPFILKLSKPVCLLAEDVTDNVKSSREIHIFSSNATIHSTIARFVGRHVIVSGNAFPAHTRYHHASIVMDVGRID